MDPTLEPAPAAETLPASAPAPAPTAEATPPPADVQFRVGDFVFTNAPPYTWGGELVVELDTREMEQKMQKEMNELQDSRIRC